MRQSIHTFSQLDDTELERLDPVQEAVLFIYDAVMYSQHSTPQKGLIPRRLHHVSVRMRPWVRSFLVLLIGINFFELPGWCARDEDCKASLENGHLTGEWNSGASFFWWNRTDAEDVQYPLIGLPIAPFWATMTLEFVIHVVLFAELLCRVLSQGIRRFIVSSPQREVVYGTCLVVSLVDGLARLASPWPYGYLAPYLRMVLLCAYSPPILSQMRLILNTLKPLSGIALVLGAFILFTSWMGVILFASMEPGSQARIYFPNWAETAWQLWVLLTTSNFPDVMMPAYDRARASFAFFFVFLVLGTFFLLNVVIAVVCNEYNRAVQVETEEKKDFRERRLRKAFAILMTSEKAAPSAGMAPGALPRDLLEDVFVEINSYGTLVHYMDKDRMRVLFGALDVDRDGLVSEEEFMHLGSLLAVRWRRVRSPVGYLARRFPASFNSPRFQAFELCVRHRAFDLSVDGMLLVNAVLLFIEERAILDGTADKINYEEMPWARPTAILFTGFFMAEMVAKLLALGWHEYVASKSNCFDGFVTLISLGVTIYEISTWGSSDEFLRYVLVLRLGRFCRLLGAIPQVSLVAATFMRMIPAASKLLQVLFIAMYFFATLGQQLFGGKINFGPQYANLSATEYGEDDYYSNNFNDLGSGLVLCFEFLVVNNWHIIVSGFSAVANVTLVRLFFSSVYVFGVLVCLNIVVAFALESFNEASSRMTRGLDPEANAEDEMAESRLADAEDADIANGDCGPYVREHSASIQEAQGRLEAIVPHHVPRSSSITARLQQAKKPSPRRSIVQISDCNGSSSST